MSDKATEPTAPAKTPAMRIDDAELMVMAKIVSELKPLDKKQAQNIIVWLARRYGVMWVNEDEED